MSRLSQGRTPVHHTEGTECAACHGAAPSITRMGCWVSLPSQGWVTHTFFDAKKLPRSHHAAPTPLMFHPQFSLDCLSLHALLPRLCIPLLLLLLLQDQPCLHLLLKAGEAL